MAGREPPASPADSAFRAALRRERLAARAALPAAEHAALSLRLAGHLHAAFDALPPGRIGFCAAFRGEFDALPVIRRLLAAGWEACMPVAEQPEAPLVFRTWTPQTVMANDRFGIAVPQAAPLSPPPGLLLLPLVAFDAAGFRLGYGGGYFDRTLAATVPRPLAVGIGFELARTGSVRPQPHDIPCDAIVTENGWQMVPGGRMPDAIPTMQTS